MFLWTATKWIFLFWQSWSGHPKRRFFFFAVFTTAVFTSIESVVLLINKSSRHKNRNDLVSFRKTIHLNFDVSNEGIQIKLWMKTRRMGACNRDLRLGCTRFNDRICFVPWEVSFISEGPSFFLCAHQKWLKFFPVEPDFYDNFRSKCYRCNLRRQTRLFLIWQTLHAAACTILKSPRKNENRRGRK